MDTTTLTETFKKADEAAIAAGMADPEDGGTCNLDAPAVFFPKGTREAKVQEAAKAAGITVYKFSWIGRTAYRIGTATRGQGFQRTQMVEAATKVLKAAGLTATVYYRMD